MYESILLIWLWQALLIFFVRSAAVYISINHSTLTTFVESYSLKTVMSCGKELVRFVCFCVVHKVLVYWHITSPKGSVSVGRGCQCPPSFHWGSPLPMVWERGAG